MSSPIDLTSPTPPSFRTRLSSHDSDDEPLTYPSFSPSRLAIPRRDDSHSHSRGSSAASGSAGGPSNLAATATGSGSRSSNPNPNLLSRLIRQSSPATDEELAEDFRDLRDHDYPVEDDGEVENLFGGTGFSVRETRTAPRDRERGRSGGSDEDGPSTTSRRLGSLLNNSRRAGARRLSSPSAGDEGITATFHRRGNRTERFRSPSSEPLSSAPASPPLSPATGLGPSNAQTAVPSHLPVPVPITQVTGAAARRRAIMDAMQDRRAERAGRREREQGRSQARGTPGLEVRPMAPLPRRGPGAGTGAGPGARDVIDLANESDDEEFEVTGANITARQRPVLSRQASGQEARGAGTGQQARFPEARRGLHALNEVLERRRRQAEAIFNDEADERRRAVLSPPAAAAAPQPPIRLGGAVFRAGNRQINYEAQPAGGPNRPRHRAVRTPSPPPGGRGGRHFGDMDGGAHGIFDRLFNFLPGLGGHDHPAGFADLLMGALPMFAGGNGAGPAGIRREDDVQTIIAAVPEFQYPDVPADFTRDFEVVDKQPIALDDNGKVIPSNSKPFLACAKCAEPLLLSSAYRSPGDRVWVLRCGHMVDQKCLDEMSTPTTSAELAKVLPPMGEPLDMPDAPVRRGRKKARVSKKEASAPRVYNYTCPVKGCGKVHAATQSAGQQGWAQREGDGALQAYA